MNRIPDCSNVVVIVPHCVGIGASVSIRVGLWHCAQGRRVREGQRLVELSIGPLAYQVHAPCDGRLIKHSADEDDLVSAGSILGVIIKDGHDSTPES
ncbi:MAG: biotin/lipoyl-containing protein [Planctomycetota bacterium]